MWITQKTPERASAFLGAGTLKCDLGSHRGILGNTCQKQHVTTIIKRPKARNRQIIPQAPCGGPQPATPPRGAVFRVEPSQNTNTILACRACPRGYLAELGGAASELKQSGLPVGRDTGGCRNGSCVGWLHAGSRLALSS